MTPPDVSISRRDGETEICPACGNREAFEDAFVIPQWSGQPYWKNWGTKVIPPASWVNPAWQYKTRSGKRVVNMSIKLHNDNGDEFTFPIKGTVVVREKPLKCEYHIWTLDGRHDVMKDLGEDELDLSLISRTALSES